VTLDYNESKEAGGFMTQFKHDKIVFSDLDSTLLNGDGYFSNVTKAMVKECYQKGLLFIPLTARSTDDVFRQAKRLGIDQLGGIIGANNGSQIYDFGANKWIKNEYLPHEVVEEIFHATYKRYLAKVHYFSDDATLVYAKGNNSLYWAQMMGSDYVIVDHADQLDVPISHLTIVLKKQLTQMELEIINREVFDKIKGKVDINRYSQRVFDICPIGVSKGHAVDDIIAYLG
jgi:hypothetical protein